MLLNHVPTIGFGLALAMFLVALARNNDGLKRTGLALFFVVATVAIATYVTGNGAESVIKGRPDVSQTAIRAHEDAALLAFTFMEVTGFFAWLALWQWRRVPRLAGWNVPVVLILAVASFLLMAKAATLGGEITHAEIRSAAEAIELGHQAFDRDARYYDLDPQKLLEGDALEPLLPDFKVQKAQDLFEAIGYGKVATRRVLARLVPGQAFREKLASDAAAVEPSGTARAIGLFVSGQTWVWPTCETLHFVGLCMLFTVVLIVDLRMLGMIKSVSFEAVYQLLPIGMLGFGINLVTGMLFFIGVPGQYVHNGTFFFKIVFVLLGGLNVLYFTLDDEPWAVKAGQDAPLTAKIAAASAIFVWVAVLFCGHMLPFIGNAF
ncbi:MAG: hypothetical protein ABJA98_00215 [Acidobacteriota bacterium]